MKWTTKARIQNLIAALPGPLSDFCYYRMQRLAGGLRNPTPVKQIDGGCQLAAAIQEQRPLDGARVMEVGSGRSLAIPVLMWLLGAKRVLTVDLNRYLRPEVLRADLAYLRANQPWLNEQLAPLAGESGPTSGRLRDLLALDLEGPPARLPEDLLRLCGIDYRAPADAAALDLADGSIDVHLSRAVLEHVPPDDLAGILREASRVLKPDGLCVHLIDLSDHFQHQDTSISRVNFLRYSEAEWERLAGNRFMFMNRLRAGDYLTIFAEAGLELLDQSRVVDDEALRLIESGALPLDGRFEGRTPEDLATTRLLVVARPAPARA
ncbi:MAG: methyltransferase domain-containing protein [Anaerolineaceae bacterium]|nr:methyltransferase domain-containing protein [Anaerolineaceae bacterium]MDE0329076.1 methyltransferase domain-containing protein [Anaerolineaceae bacterium]